MEVLRCDMCSVLQLRLCTCMYLNVTIPYIMWCNRPYYLFVCQHFVLGSACVVMTYDHECLIKSLSLEVIFRMYETRLLCSHKQNTKHEIPLSYNAIRSIFATFHF